MTAARRRYLPGLKEGRMGTFHEALISENTHLLERVWNHPYAVRLASGKLTEKELLRWLSQTYLYVRSYEQVISQLVVRAPDALRLPLLSSLRNIHESMESFQEYVARTVSDLMQTRMSFACHAFSHFLLASVHAHPFEESIVACYGADYGFIHTWLNLEDHNTKRGATHDLIGLFNQQGLIAWLDDLVGFIDRAAETASPEQRRLMREMFPLPIHYLIRYWDSFATSTDW
jgi:thiaminase/transcriptional activator TenA